MGSGPQGLAARCAWRLVPVWHRWWAWYRLVAWPCCRPPTRPRFWDGWQCREAKRRAVVQLLRWGGPRQAIRWLCPLQRGDWLPSRRGGAMGVWRTEWQSGTRSSPPCRVWPVHPPAHSRERVLVPLPVWHPGLEGPQVRGRVCGCLPPRGWRMCTAPKCHAAARPPGVGMEGGAAWACGRRSASRSGKRYIGSIRAQ